MPEHLQSELILRLNRGRQDEPSWLRSDFAWASYLTYPGPAHAAIVRVVREHIDEIPWKLYARNENMVEKILANIGDDLFDLLIRQILNEFPRDRRLVLVETFRMSEHPKLANFALRAYTPGTFENALLIELGVSGKKLRDIGRRLRRAAVGPRPINCTDTLRVLP